MTGALGSFGESWARGYLVRKGYRILRSNVRYRVGEIDIIARDGPELVFVEVKSRRSVGFGTPTDAITPSKYERLAQAIATYLQDHGLEDEEYRLDVIALQIDRHGTVAGIEHLQGVGPPD